MERQNVEGVVFVAGTSFGWMVSWCLQTSIANFTTKKPTHVKFMTIGMKQLEIDV
tara:strand:- start:2416 stop:2580 length:165 start_codon:yes stop_codon:yes gene_type:complete